MIKSILKTWLPLATIMLLMCMIVYGTVQQTYRSNANDPQIQMAEDAANALANGSNPKMLVKPGAIDMANSLLPFTLIYDSQYNPVAGDAFLNGKIPQLPYGVFTFTNMHKEDDVTWQPEAGVRIAAVAIRVTGSFNGYVVTGRSLKLVEQRESNLVKQLEFGLIVSLLALLVFTFIYQLIFKP